MSTRRSASARRAAKRWCVAWKDELGLRRWCATKTGRPHKAEAWSVKTRCGFFVHLPIGSELRVPTCGLCRGFAQAKLRARQA